MTEEQPRPPPRGLHSEGVSLPCPAEQAVPSHPQELTAAWSYLQGSGFAVWGQVPEAGRPSSPRRLGRGHHHPAGTQCREARDKPWLGVPGAGGGPPGTAPQSIFWGGHVTAPHSPSGRHSCQTFTCQQSHVLSRGNGEMNENRDREPTREPAAHSRLRARVQQPDVAGWRVSCVAVAACGMGTRSRQPGWPVTPRRWPSGGLCTGSARAVSSAPSSRKPLFVSSFFSVTGEAHVTSASGAQHALRHARSLQ